MDERAQKKGRSLGWEGDTPFKDDLIRDILCQLDYQAARRNGVVDMSETELSTELGKMSTRALVNWYEAFIFIRNELIFSGAELDRPQDSVRELMDKDPMFDIREYIF